MPSFENASRAGIANLPQYNFHIDPATMQEFLALFETPSPEKGSEVVGIRDGVTPLANGSDDLRAC